MRAVALLALFTAVAACSSQPTVPQQREAPVPAASEPAAPAVGATVPPVAPAGDPAAPGAVAGSATETTVRKIPSGYRMEKRNGKEFYCRNITTLGSRFPQKTCFTRAQLEEIQQRTDSTMQDMDRGMRVCAGGEVCGQGT